MTNSRWRKAGVNNSMIPVSFEKDRIKHPKQRKNGWTEQEEDI
jgi:hypothetical protein